MAAEQEMVEETYSSIKPQVGALKPDVRQRWVDALRSGDFTQSQSNLRDDKGYCCLGVLCEVAGVEGEWVSTTSGIGTGPFYAWARPGSGNPDSVSYPSRDVTLEVINDGFDWMNVQEVFSSLACLNDLEVPFVEIADEIERVL